MPCRQYRFGGTILAMCSPINRFFCSFHCFSGPPTPRPTLSQRDGTCHFSEFFFALRNPAGLGGSVAPTIRAGLACGIVKLKLDLAGSRKRPRLVFAWAQIGRAHV